MIGIGKKSLGGGFGLFGRVYTSEQVNEKKKKEYKRIALSVYNNDLRKRYKKWNH